jgi:tetratricopeptide (TPR) repeat protein
MKQLRLFAVLAAAIACVGAILFPVFARARETSRRVNTNPAYLAKQAEIRRLHREGAGALYRNEYDKAERLLQQAVTLDPRFVFAWYDLGLTLERQGRDKDALAAYQQVFHRTDTTSSSLEQDPLTVGQYGILCSRMGRWQEAVKFYETALANLRLEDTQPSPAVQLDSQTEKRPQLEAALHLMRGIVRDRRGENPLVLVEFQQAARLLPKSAVVQYYLGLGLQKNLRSAEAMVAFQNAADLGDPDLRAAAEKEQRLLKELGYVKELAGR